MTAVTKHGALLTFKDKLAFYSFKEREITNSFRLPPNTKCRGQLVVPKISSLLTVCRKSISLKTSKLYLLTVGISSKNLGIMQLVKKPLVTSSGHYRSSFIARLKRNFKNIAIFWNRPNIFEQDKVNRFFNNVFYMIDLDLMKTSELPIDFTGINEPFATITFAKMKKLESNGHIYYVVVLRGFTQSQIYKVNRYQSTIECLWDVDSKSIDRCREVLFDGERLTGTLLKINISHHHHGDSLHAKRELEFWYNISSDGGSIFHKKVSYTVSPYAVASENRGEHSSFEKGLVQKMVRNQYQPIFIDDNIIFYKDIFNKSIRLAYWYNKETKTRSIRYVDALGFRKMIGHDMLCMYNSESLKCYDWNSNAYLRSETKYISNAHTSFYFYLNYCEKISCSTPKIFEITAKIEKSEILARNDTNLSTLKVLAKPGRIQKIASSRGLLQRSSVYSFNYLNTEEGFNKPQLIIEKFSEATIYIRGEDKKEVKVALGIKNWYLGPYLFSCDIA